MSGAAGWDVDALLDDRGTTVLVCCGSGGVGKTTTAAALALRAAERGRTVCVLTIDPARRLAQSMGLAELDNTPRPVPGSDAGGGSLDAMMLDMKRTFDDVVLAHTTPDKAEQIFANPFYQALSSSFAGTQEYMAMEKLGQLRAERAPAGGGPRWDLVIVDTPPTRSALDFLDAPQNLGTFLDGRFLRLLVAPARLTGRSYLKVVSGTLGLFTRVITKILGAQLLTDLSQFVSALETMFGGFRERAKTTYDMLAAPGTAFVVVATPEPAALREAAFFVDRLAHEHMPLAGVVINRVHRTTASLSRERALAAAEELTTRGSAADDGAEAVLRVHAERAALETREGRLVGSFSHGHPAVSVAEVTARAGDVHDLAGLRGLGAELAAAGRPAPVVSS